MTPLNTVGTNGSCSSQSSDSLVTNVSPDAFTRADRPIRRAKGDSLMMGDQICRKPMTNSRRRKPRNMVQKIGVAGDPISAISMIQCGTCRHASVETCSPLSNKVCAERVFRASRDSVAAEASKNEAVGDRRAREPKVTKIPNRRDGMRRRNGWRSVGSGEQITRMQGQRRLDGQRSLQIDFGGNDALINQSIGV